MKNRKWELCVKTCTFWGHFVGNGMVALEEAKQATIWGFESPQTKSDVRSFLGHACYYRRLILVFSGVAVPLSYLTGSFSPTHVTWSPECVNEFQQQKEALVSGPVLACPDYEREFISQTYASEQGIGALLSQRNAGRVVRLVASPGSCCLGKAAT